MGTGASEATGPLLATGRGTDRVLATSTPSASSPCPCPRPRAGLWRPRGHQELGTASPGPSPFTCPRVCPAQAQKQNYRQEKKRATKQLFSALTDPSVVIMADSLKVGALSTRIVLALATAQSGGLPGGRWKVASHLGDSSAYSLLQICVSVRRLP